MNKKGFGKTLEATIAIILILTFIYYFSPKPVTDEPLVPENVRQAQTFILEQISTTDTLRDCLVSVPATGTCEAVCTDVHSFVQRNKAFGYTAACEVCDSASTCTPNMPSDVSLFTDSVFIAGDNPKVVRLYFWGQ